MLLPDPQANGAAFLILRHLYDGDVIEWPIAEDHPMRPVFQALETQGLIARWDRVWPLADRYRLTEKGIAAIESVYRPAGAEAFFDELRRANLSPADRRGYLQTRGLDPNLWPLLHDPTTHWSTFGSERPRYQSYVWEDQLPPRPRRTRPQKTPGRRGVVGRGPVVHHHHHHHHPRDIHLVDLDREGQDPGMPAPLAADYDVS